MGLNVCETNLYYCLVMSGKKIVKPSNKPLLRDVNAKQPDAILVKTREEK